MTRTNSQLRVDPPDPRTLRRPALVRDGAIVRNMAPMGTRAFDRTKCDKPVTIGSGFDTTGGTIVDYSAGGLGLRLDGPLPRSETITVYYKRAQVSLRVAWIRGNRLGGQFADERGE